MTEVPEVGQIVLIDHNQSDPGLVLEHITQSTLNPDHKILCVIETLTVEQTGWHTRRYPKELSPVTIDDLPPCVAERVYSRRLKLGELTLVTLPTSNLDM